MIVGVLSPSIVETKATRAMEGEAFRPTAMRPQVFPDLEQDDSQVLFKQVSVVDLTTNIAASKLLWTG